MCHGETRLKPTNDRILDLTLRCLIKADYSLLAPDILIDIEVSMVTMILSILRPARLVSYIRFLKGVHGGIGMNFMYVFVNVCIKIKYHQMSLIE
jgi:hypothetical protein